MAIPSRAAAINPRETWASNRPPLGPLGAEDVRFLIVHHSASRNGHTGADAPGIIRSFYDYHTSPEKGWNDIAYNFLIDADGGIWEGRAGSLDGAVAGDATGGNQGFSQLVCIIGDYNTARPSQASLSSLVWLLAWLADRHGVSTAPGAEVTFTSRGSNRHAAGSSVTTPTITGHRTMSRTTCPGDNLNAYVVGSLMADVESARSGGSPAPSPTSTPTTASTSTTTPSTSSSTTTTAPPATTTLAPVSTSAPPSTTMAVTPASTLPVAADTSVDEVLRPGGIAAGAILVAAGAGLILWRHRRMNGD